MAAEDFRRSRSTSVPDLAELGAVTEFSAVPPISYATAPNAPIYRAIMRIFHENREVYGQLLSPATVQERLAQRTGTAVGFDALCLYLEQLDRWGAVVSRQDTTRVQVASELIRKQLIYDITPAGELCERFLEDIDNLRDHTGSLQAQRLPDILTELKRIADALSQPEPDGALLSNALTNLVGALAELREGSNAFMRDLSRLEHSTDALDEDRFNDYKQQVIDYLLGFHRNLDLYAHRISATIDEIEGLGVERLIDLVAGVREAPQYDLTPAEVRARSASAARRQWQGVRSWFAYEDGQAHFQLLNSKIHDAIEWILRTVQRLKERRSQRIDRSQEYRHLARLFHTGSDDEAHALFHAAFGLSAPRHFGCPEEDPELVDGQRSFWTAPAVPIEAHLRNPARRVSGAGRGVRIGSNEMAQQALHERRIRERAELEQALRRLAVNRTLSLSDIGSLGQIEFEHLLAWLGRALEAAAEPDGARRAESSDGTVLIVLRRPVDPAATTTLTTPSGRFTGPDYLLEIRR